MSVLRPGQRGAANIFGMQLKPELVAWTRVFEPGSEMLFQGGKSIVQQFSE